MQVHEPPSTVLTRYGTGPVSDALDMLGLGGGLEGLWRQSGNGVVAGPAFTLRMEPVESGGSAFAADYIDDAPPGSVIVIANAGRRDCTVFGDILAEVALCRGIPGTVIDGCNRDVDDIRRLDYSVWSLGSYMKSGKNRARLTAVDVPVEVCGTTVSPGDLVVADGSGVVVVPAAQIAVAAERAEWILEVEGHIRADLDRGVPLRESRRRHGYHRAALRTGRV